MSDYSSKNIKLGDDFFTNEFNIPLYQRLYVWGEEQVNTLINDLISAFKHDAKHIYYLGGIVVVQNKNIYDLIDGQQRFTTLKILRELLDDSNLTLKFSVREDVWKEFDSGNSKNADIKRMLIAKKLLSNNLDNANIKKDKFLSYLKEKVHLVVTTVPQNADLNKLFELINGRGEQLLQHEILKAKILAKINEENRTSYGKIWDICANMDEHIEVSIKKSIYGSWKEYFDDKKTCFDDIVEKLNIEDAHTEGKKISEIIRSTQSENGINTVTKSEDESQIQYLSIISFPLLLLYALESFKDKKIVSEPVIEFKDKNLIKIFEQKLLDNKADSNAEEFIKHLFEFRMKFDKWIIRNKKEIDDNSNETEHRITEIKSIKINSTINMQVKLVDDSRGLALLQSMLYHAHTRQTQEWIIPFLNNIKDKTDENIELLKKIDDFLYSNIDAKGTVLSRANIFDENNCSINSDNIIEHLEKTPENYHHFSQYWFYKMDWIIWNEKKEDNEFKFTARNSIEHISPQNPQEGNIEKDKVSDEQLHSFGNLFLVSVSENSSVGNEGFKTKIDKFVGDKKIKNLKLSLISKEEGWGDDGVKKHLEECIEKIKSYYGTKQT